MFELKTKDDKFFIPLDKICYIREDKAEYRIHMMDGDRITVEIEDAKAVEQMENLISALRIHHTRLYK